MLHSAVQSSRGIRQFHSLQPAKDVWLHPDTMALTMRMCHRLGRAAAILILVGPTQAQNRQVQENFRVWFAYFGDHGFGDSRWSLHLEAHVRRQDELTQWQQLLLRPE
jgi:hypothetical protein